MLQKMPFSFQKRKKKKTEQNKWCLKIMLKWRAWYVQRVYYYQMPCENFSKDSQNLNK